MMIKSPTLKIFIWVWALACNANYVCYISSLGEEKNSSGALFWCDLCSAAIVDYISDRRAEHPCHILFSSSSYCIFFSLSFTSFLHSLSHSSSRLLISRHRYCSLLIFHHCFNSLSKEADVFLVWFIQMQRLGLRESAAGRMHSAQVQMVEYTSYPHSWCKWVFLIHMNQAFSFFYLFSWRNFNIGADMT